MLLNAVETKTHNLNVVVVEQNMKDEEEYIKGIGR